MGRGIVCAGWGRVGGEDEGEAEGRRLRHSMVRAELIRPVESSSSLRLVTLLQSIFAKWMEKVRGEQKRRRGGEGLVWTRSVEERRRASFSL